jgi:hypothetical protein
MKDRQPETAVESHTSPKTLTSRSSSPRGPCSPHPSARESWRRSGRSRVEDEASPQPGNLGPDVGTSSKLGGLAAPLATREDVRSLRSPLGQHSPRADWAPLPRQRTNSQVGRDAPAVDLSTTPVSGQRDCSHQACAPCQAVDTRLPDHPKQQDPGWVGTGACNEDQGGPPPLAPLPSDR